MTNGVMKIIIIIGANGGTVVASSYCPIERVIPRVYKQ